MTEVPLSSIVLFMLSNSASELFEPPVTAVLFNHADPLLYKSKLEFNVESLKVMWLFSLIETFPLKVVFCVSPDVVLVN